MGIFVAGVGFFLILVVLWEAFETIVLPRRVTRRFRLTRLFYRFIWQSGTAIARRIRSFKRREAYLAIYGPLSLLLLFTLWAVALVFGFALVKWGLKLPYIAPEGRPGLGTYLYVSGTTFFTLGLGDVTPLGTTGRILAVVEAGTGFGFLATLISYLPVLYQAFSQREVTISLLDARAGSPPSAAELLRRHGPGPEMVDLGRLLRDWEHWAAELMESHLSYPVLSFFRSQHDNQSWLGALTTILDTCALVITGIDGAPTRQAHLTFAMARHAVVDLSQIFNTPPRPPTPDRLPHADLARLRKSLAAAGIVLRDGAAADAKLAELRHMYEPYVYALADYLFITLPRWILPADVADNWQTSAWERRSTGFKLSPCSEDRPDEEHF